MVNSLIVLFFLPTEKDYEEQQKEESNEKTKPNDQQSAVQRVLSNFKACFQSNNPCLTSAVVAQLLFQWVTRTTTYKNISTYFEIRYGTEPHQRGYLSSYQMAISFVVQSFLIKPILQHLGGEVNAACAASLLMALVTFAETQVTFAQYLYLICPLMMLSTAILGVSIKSIVSKVAPKESLSSVFATIDVLQNVAMVTVPFYRTLLFQLTRDVLSEDGDPNPHQWLFASGVHWAVATAAFSYLLLQDNPCAKSLSTESSDKKTN